MFPFSGLAFDGVGLGSHPSSGWGQLLCMGATSRALLAMQPPPTRASLRDTPDAQAIEGARLDGAIEP